jgi:hypothetical protein
VDNSITNIVDVNLTFEIIIKMSSPIKIKLKNKVSENKSDIILIENIAFNYLLINYFSLGHQVSPLKPLLD